MPISAGQCINKLINISINQSIKPIQNQLFIDHLSLGITFSHKLLCKTTQIDKWQSALL